MDKGLKTLVASAHKSPQRMINMPLMSSGDETAWQIRNRLPRGPSSPGKQSRHSSFRILWDFKWNDIQIFAEDNTRGTGKSGWERAWCRGNQFPSIIGSVGEEGCQLRPWNTGGEAGVDLKDWIWGVSEQCSQLMLVSPLSSRTSPPRHFYHMLWEAEAQMLRNLPKDTKPVLGRVRFSPVQSCIRVHIFTCCFFQIGKKSCSKVLKFVAQWVLLLWREGITCPLNVGACEGGSHLRSLFPCGQLSGHPGASHLSFTCHCTLPANWPFPPWMYHSMWSS